MGDEHCWILKKDGESAVDCRPSLRGGGVGHSFAYMGNYRCVSLDIV
jgi:hypothetical protein